MSLPANPGRLFSCLQSESLGTVCISLYARRPNRLLTLLESEADFPGLAEVRNAAPPVTPTPQSPNRVRQLSIGRNPHSDIQLDRQAISWDHAVLVQDSQGRVSLEDLGSTNGTFLNSTSNRVQTTTIQAGDTVYFGDLPVSAERLLSAVSHPERRISVGAGATSRFRISGRSLILGRADNAGHRLDHPTISWEHARITREIGGRFHIEDLNSTNGTFVDGVRVESKVEVRPGQLIWLGTYSFRLTAAGEVEQRDSSNDLRIEVRDVAVESPGPKSSTKTLITGISMAIEPGELVALMGPSGAGKTTLLDVLNGLHPTSRGQVLYGGMPLESNYEYFRSRIGYVPQDDIMHTQLTVWQALYYTARLRMPAGTPESSILECVERVLKLVSLFEEQSAENSKPVQHRTIGKSGATGGGKGISGGQRKRLNLAMELLSDPSLLFLDEPTSGLSSTDARLVVEQLRKLAAQGKTIVVTIHQPGADVYRQFHNLAMITNHAEPGTVSQKPPGTMVFFGPAERAFEFFETQQKAASNEMRSPDEFFDAMQRKGVPYWRRKFEASSFHLLYVERRMLAGGAAAPKAQEMPAQAPRKARWRQLWTLVARLTRIKAGDPLQVAIILLTPLLLGGLIAAFRPEVELREFLGWNRFLSRLGSVHFLMVIAAVWFGCTNAIREIVGERPVFLRERMVNLSLSAYVGSKFLVLALIGLFQCLLLLGIVYPLCGLAGDFWAQAFTLFLTTLTGTALGLFLSAVSTTNEAAVLSLPLALLPMIVLGGGVLPLESLRANSRPLGLLADAAIPSRWAFEANMHFENDGRGLRFVGLTPDEMARGLQRSQTDPSSTRNPVAVRPDIAQNAFPLEKGRKQPAHCLGVLASMLTFWSVLCVAALMLPRWAIVRGGRWR